VIRPGKLACDRAVGGKPGELFILSLVVNQGATVRSWLYVAGHCSKAGGLSSGVL
jgi:hypothetical protein